MPIRPPNRTSPNSPVPVCRCRRVAPVTGRPPADGQSARLLGSMFLGSESVRKDWGTPSVWNLAPGSVEDRHQPDSEQYWWCDDLRLPRPAWPSTKRAACQFLESRQFDEDIVNRRTPVGQHGTAPTGA